jgi:hypothetical protein
MTKRQDRDSIYVKRQFDTEIIVLCVRWYISYRLSYRDLVDMMAERVFSCTGAWHEGWYPTFQADTVDTGQITYTVNGVPVVKAVQRQLLRYNDISGSYLGGIRSLKNGTASCSNGATGTFVAYEIESSLTAMTGRFEGQGNGCQFFGTLGGLRR